MTKPRFLKDVSLFISFSSCFAYFALSFSQVFKSGPLFISSKGMYLLFHTELSIIVFLLFLLWESFH